MKSLKRQGAEKMKFVRSSLSTFIVLCLVLLIVSGAFAQNTYRDASSGFLKEVTLAVSAARTTNSASSVVDLGAYAGGEIWILATAKTGTSPTLNVAFESCASNSASACVTHTAATQLTDTGSARFAVSNFGRYGRVSWTIGGSDTPGYTFSIVGVFKPFPTTATSPSTSAQGTAAGIAGAWPVQITDKSNTMPTGDAQARAINVKPGNGADAFKTVSDGVGALGAGVVQTGEVNTLSAAAGNTITQVVAAPGAGSVYLRGLLIEKISGATSTVTLSYGTGSNCGTGTTVLLGPITGSAVGFIHLGVLVPATKALCVTTDAATTVVRALTN
jgi:hypothetical protein